MKWYSVKKYRPLPGNTYFIMFNYSVDVGLFDHRSDIGYFFDVEGTGNVPISDITYFAVIEPVEIEE